MPFLPPGYEASYIYEIGRGTTEEDIGRLHELEEKEPEGTLLELEINFRFRFPLFDEVADIVDWSIRGIGVKPWPNLRRCIFTHPSFPIWWILWVRSPPWLRVIFKAIRPALEKIGVAIMAVLAFFGLYRVAPRELKPPMEFIFWIPPIMLLLMALDLVRRR